MSYTNPEEDTLATTVVPGIIEIATTAETNTGTDADKAVSESTNEIKELMKANKTTESLSLTHSLL